MTRNSDPQAEPGTTDPAVREPTEEEAERAAAQFRAAWQTQHLVPTSRTAPVAAEAAKPEPATDPASTDITAHPILAIAPPEGAGAPPEAPAAAPLLGRTMVGVPPPAAASASAPEPIAHQPPVAHFNRTVVGLALPAPASGLEAGHSPPATAAVAHAAPAGAAEQPASNVQNGTQRLQSAPPGGGSFPPSAGAQYFQEPQPNRISVRPNVISAWDIPEPNRRSRRAPSPALIVLVVASVALLILVATRFLGSDSEPTTEDGQPTRTEAVLAEDEAADQRTPTTSVQAAKPGSSVE